MAAVEHLNANQHRHYQLPMFVRATDLRESITGTIDYSLDDPDEVMENKLAESKNKTGRGGGVYDSVAKEGVLNPIQLIHGTNRNLIAGQGSHRMAAADDIMRQTGKDMWVGVVHTQADESSDNPVGTYSDLATKRAAVADYTEWKIDTPALGQDIMWSDQRRGKR